MWAIADGGRETGFLGIFLVTRRQKLVETGFLRVRNWRYQVGENLKGRSHMGGEKPGFLGYLS
ncbi:MULTISPECIES: hypothetical protein [unclassified Microcoleus]|uniref:hypothetical protein n=1 Tax=unclassified Microcoleus TaxID=2642155 RepID=UPI002FD3DA28